MYHNTSFISYGPKMHHCASIAQDGSGFWLVNYFGRECTDDQRVVIGYAKSHGKILDYIKLDAKTGNPLVWNFNGSIYMMCSQFTDSTEDGTPIDYGLATVNRWKNCKNYLFKLRFDGISIVKEKYGEIFGTYGLLARCQPLIEDNRVLLPLYREQDPVCQMWEFTIDDGNPKIEKLSEFGGIDDRLRKLCADNDLYMGNLGEGVAIQPTIIRNDDRYVAFCRNVCRSSSQKSGAWISISDDCVSWDNMKICEIPNHNNSIAAITYYGVGDLLVFNTTRTRNTMILYNTKSGNRMNIGHPFNCKASYSYPNLMIDAEGNLHVVHTNCGTIAWHVFDEKYVNNKL